MCFCFACFLFHPQHFSPTKSWDELHIGLLWLIESLGLYSTPVSRAVDHWIFLAMVATTSIVPRQQTWAGRGAELNSNSIRSKLEWTYPYSIEASLDIETHLLSFGGIFSASFGGLTYRTWGYRCFRCLGPSQLETQRRTPPKTLPTKADDFTTQPKEPKNLAFFKNDEVLRPLKDILAPWRSNVQEADLLFLPGWLVGKTPKR